MLSESYIKLLNKIILNYFNNFDTIFNIKSYIVLLFKIIDYIIDLSFNIYLLYYSFYLLFYKK